MSAWRLAALLLLAACASRSAMNVPPLILDLLAPVPESMEAEEAQAAFTNLEPVYARAKHLYDAGEYAAAGTTFLSAARAARGAPGNSSWKLMAANRASCYRNAAKAWYMAGLFVEKRALLEEAAREDPLCAADIREILEILG